MRVELSGRRNPLQCCCFDDPEITFNYRKIIVTGLQAFTLNPVMQDALEVEKEEDPSSSEKAQTNACPCQVNL